MICIMNETEFIINMICGLIGLVFAMFIFVLSANNKAEKRQSDTYKKLLDVDERIIYLLLKDELKTAIENEDYKRAEECQKLLNGYGKR